MVMGVLFLERHFGGDLAGDRQWVGKSYMVDGDRLS